MAVHTELEASEIAALCRAAGLEPVRSVEGVPEGSIHTTYRVWTATGEIYYLRLAEGLDTAAVETELRLLAHLGSRGLPVPGVCHPRSGERPAHLRGRPVVLFEGLPGAPLPRAQIDPEACRQVGEALGRLHRAGSELSGRRPNRFGPETVATWVEALDGEGLSGPRDPRRGLDGSLRRHLATSLAESRGVFDAALPAGWVHGDLFTDNVLFQAGRLSGLLDFEMACTAPFVLDLAIAALVWGWEEGFDRSRLTALAEGYQACRPLEAEEWAALHGAARFACVRYTVSRLRDFEASALSAARLKRKDWRRFYRRLADVEAHSPEDFAALLGGPA